MHERHTDQLLVAQLDHQSRCKAYNSGQARRPKALPTYERQRAVPKVDPHDAQRCGKGWEGHMWGGTFVTVSVLQGRCNGIYRQAPRRWCLADRGMDDCSTACDSMPAPKLHFPFSLINNGCPPSPRSLLDSSISCRPSTRSRLSQMRTTLPDRMVTPVRRRPTCGSGQQVGGIGYYCRGAVAQGARLQMAAHCHELQSASNDAADSRVRPSMSPPTAHTKRTMQLSPVWQCGPCMQACRLPSYEASQPSRASSSEGHARQPSAVG